MSKPSLTNCPKLAHAPAARGVPAQSWYERRNRLALKLKRNEVNKKLSNMSAIPVVIALGFHLFPFRTEKLSPSAPMVLHTRGRVGRRRLYLEASL